MLTFGIVSLTFFQLHPQTEGTTGLTSRNGSADWPASSCCSTFTLSTSICNCSASGAVLAERDQLFQLITENAADMIAVVDGAGQRIYNSPAYEHVLGYSAEELKTTSSIEQIHPDDRAARAGGGAQGAFHGPGAEAGIPDTTQGRFVAHPGIDRQRRARTRRGKPKSW